MRNSPYITGGPITRENDSVYCVRAADLEIIRHLQKMDYVLMIEARQQGKTSFANRLICENPIDNMTYLFVDLSSLEYSTEKGWYHTLCTRLLRQLDFLEIKNFPVIPCCGSEWREFLYQLCVIFNNIEKKVFIILDEIAGAKFPGTTQFFTVIREVYNSREAEKVFKSLGFILMGSFVPDELISDTRISPFNVAQRIRLADFTEDQIIELTLKGDWDTDLCIILGKRIYEWTNGHPYLTQLILANLGENPSEADIDVSVDRIRRKKGEWLLPKQKALEEDPNLRNYVRRILHGENIYFYPYENVRHAQLELLGIIKEDNPTGFCRIRNRIMETMLETIIDSDPAIAPIMGELKPLPKVSARLINQAHAILSRCHEFENDSRLHSVFNVPDLSPFQQGLEDAKNIESRVDLFLDFILKQVHNEKGPVFPIFLDVIYKKYSPGDALKTDLYNLYHSVMSELKLPLPQDRLDND